MRDQTAHGEKPFDLRHHARLIWRRRGLVLLCWIAGMCATLVALAFIPKEYESEVTLMIEDNRLLSNELHEVTGGIMQNPEGYGIDEERMGKLVGRIQSRPFLERVIRMLKINEDPRVIAKAEEERRKHPEATVDEMAIRILVKSLQSRITFARLGMGIYKVIVADYSAENARMLAKWISSIFVDISNQSSIDHLKAAHEFGSEQLKIYEQQLHQSEQALEQYKASAIQRSLTQTIVRSDNLAFAEALNQRVEDEVSAARVRLKTFSTNLNGLGVNEDATALAGDARLSDLSRNLATALKNALTDRLSGSVGEGKDWPPQGAYRGIQGDLLQEAETVAASHYANTNPEVIAAVARVIYSRIDLDAQTEAAEMLNSAVSDFRRQAEASPTGEIEMTRLESEVETNRKLLQSFQSQLVASDVSQAVEITKLGMQIEILDPASLPLAPSRPNRVKIIILSFILGPVIGLGVAFMTEAMDPTLRTLEDFSKVIPEPVLGTTPLLSRLAHRGGKFRRYWIPATMVGVVLLTATFLVVRTNVLRNMAAVGQPVQMVNPEKALNENR